MKLTTALLVALSGASLLAQQQPTPEQQIAQLRRERAQFQVQFGACSYELGTVNAQISDGVLMTATQFKAQLEAKNPGKTLNGEWQIVDAPTRAKE